MIAVGLYALAALAGLAGAILGLAGMLGRVWSLRVDAVVPLGGLELTMDPLAGLFIAVAGAATVATSLTAAGGGDETRRGAGTYLLFVAAMGVPPTRSRSSSPGSSCRWPRGRWCSTGATTTPGMRPGSTP